MVEEQKLNVIAGFWKRIAALFIDAVFLGLFGYILGLGLEDKFIELGGWGRFVGFFIALAYFGVLNSSSANGQTLGKKILNIRVVNAGHKPVSLVISFVRYCIVGIPFFLNNARFTAESLTSFWLYPLSLVIFGGMLSIIYLYVFNRATRQSLHDLIVGTYVVNSNADHKPLGQVWKSHLIVVSIIFIAAAVVPLFTTSLANKAPFKDMLSAQQSLMEEPTVGYATIQSGQSTSNGKTTTYVSSQVYLKKNSIADSVLARRLAAVIMDKISDAAKKDVVQVNLIYGYDIGITSKWNNQTHSFSPNELGAHQ